MSNTSLYQKIITSPQNVGFKDIFWGMKNKHTESDQDYAMAAGTAFDTVQTELGMLQKWQQPWLYLRVLLVGMAASAVLAGAVLLMILVTDGGISFYPALNLLVIMIPPCIVPFALMIFFWEMNAPRDISLLQMLGYFVTGGVLSLVLTGIFNTFVSMDAAYWAPLTEEPGKLLASLFFLRKIYQKRGKIYGFTGLAVGAAVGAGFAAFETAQYAYGCLPVVDVRYGDYIVKAAVISMDTEVLLSVVLLILLRSVCALSSHVLYCCPYSCIAALNMEQTGDWKDAFRGKLFWFLFLISCLCHGVWNSNIGANINIFIRLIPFVVFTWCMAVFAIRLSFKQLVDKIAVNSSRGNKFSIQGTRGIHAGIVFSISSSEILIGTDSVCKITYPIHLNEVQKQHCKLVLQNGELYLGDMGSKTGTYLNGTKLPPLKGYPLKSGDVFSIGGNEQEFRVV